jgi:hypothetical protein
MRLFVEAMPILSSTRLVAVLSLKAIINRQASLSGKVAPSLKWYFRMPEPGTMSDSCRVTMSVSLTLPSAAWE